VSVDTDLYTALSPLAEVYQDLAPKGAGLPRITYFDVGGAKSINYLDRATIPDKRAARKQVNVWAATRDQANAMAGQVENALRPVATFIHGSFVAVYEEDTGLYGTRQDFTLNG
jgi:hypothetical protein